MEVTVAGEILSDDSRADNLAIADDELSVSLVAHGELSECGDDERIDDPEKNRGDNCVANGNNKRAAHEFCSLHQVQAFEGQVNQLDSNERRNDAANAVNDEVAAQQGLCGHGLILHALQRQRDKRDDDKSVENN